MFQTHFLDEVHGDDCSIALADMSEDDLMKGFDG